MTAGFNSFGAGLNAYRHSGYNARGGGGATIWCLDPDGVLIWSYDTTIPPVHMFILGTVLYAATSTTLYLFDAPSGALANSFSHGITIGFGDELVVSVFSGGDVLLSCPTQFAMKRMTPAGATVWSESVGMIARVLGSNVFASMRMGVNSVRRILYSGLDGSEIHALDTALPPQEGLTADFEGPLLNPTGFAAACRYNLAGFNQPAFAVYRIDTATLVHSGVRFFTQSVTGAIQAFRSHSANDAVVAAKSNSTADGLASWAFYPEGSGWRVEMGPTNHAAVRDDGSVAFSRSNSLSAPVHAVRMFDQSGAELWNFSPAANYEPTSLVADAAGRLCLCGLRVA